MERAALESEGILDVFTRHAVLVSKHRGGFLYPVGVAQPAAVVGLLEAGVPKKNMPK